VSYMRKFICTHLQVLMSLQDRFVVFVVLFKASNKLHVLGMSVLFP